MSFKLYPFLLFVLGAVNVFAQPPQIKDGINEKTEEVYNIGEVRGTIKRKAAYLPKPRYPREALEAGADGTIRVEVTIDAEGNVVSAKAVSGNPLLFAVSEEAARKTKFRSNDAATGETGFLTYNYVIQAATWLRIGYDLAVIQKAPTLRPFIVSRIAKAFQPEWKSEHEILGKLAEMRRIEVETENALPNDDRPGFVRRSVPTTMGQAEVRAQIIMPRMNPPTPERTALAQNLVTSLQNRLAGDEANLWKLNLGANLFNAFLLTRNSVEMRNAAQILRRSLDSAPANTPAETLAALRELIGIFENGRRSTETLDELGKAMSVLFKIK
jgi:TonB family protein